MTIGEVLNLIAIIITPIVAVLVGQHLQNVSEKRKDKLYVFKVLMTARIYGWTQESVHAMNLIDVVFADDADVRTAWKSLFEHYQNDNPTNEQLEIIQELQYNLLETMAKSLGYKDDTASYMIHHPYRPKGLENHINNRTQSQQNYDAVLSNIMDYISHGNDINSSHICEEESE